MFYLHIYVNIDWNNTSEKMFILGGGWPKIHIGRTGAPGEAFNKAYKKGYRIKGLTI